ncbi:hypothetical protein SDJN02_13059 [Cucurbita argyrosperma subsp. argyrosperma]|nr:hypothetical protein SDJN02_13059 [Cucurbita argyrosperma subsp. argyrosperma]
MTGPSQEVISKAIADKIALQAASEGIPILPEKLRPEMLLLACDAERTSRIKISCNWRKYIICGRFGHSCRHYWAKEGDFNLYFLSPSSPRLTEPYGREWTLKKYY